MASPTAINLTLKLAAPPPSERPKLDHEKDDKKEKRYVVVNNMW